MDNLSIRAADVQKINDKGKVTFPGRYRKLLWDNDQMKVTNFDDVNQFVKRDYREGWKLGEK